MKEVYVQQPLFGVKSGWRPPNLSDLPSWSGAKRIAFDVETNDEHLRKLGPGVRRGGYIVGISYKIEGGPGHYLPMRHHGGDNLDPKQVLRYVKDNAKYFDGELVGANLPYDLDYSEEAEVVWPKVKWFRDVQVADPLIFELHQHYSLEEICRRWGVPGKDETHLRAAADAHGVDPKSELWKLAARHVGLYGEGDTDRPLLVLRKQEERIEKLGLRKVYDLESRLLPVLVKMRRRGVRVDLEKLEAIKQWAANQERACCAEIHRLTGRRFGLGDVGKPKVLAPLLAELGISVGKTATGLDQIDKGVLAGIDHPIARAIERGRKVNKLRTTFVDSIERYQTNGRIHCTINQLRGARDFEADGSKGAKFGRCSCSDPNMQQQPSRDDFAKMWREIYIPEEGTLWTSCDFSQQEPRMAIHFSIAAGPSRIGRFAYEAALAMARRYAEDPSTDFHRAVVEATGNKVTRTDAKPIGLGRMYGMGEAKLCDTLGLPTVDAIYDPVAYEKVYQDMEPDRFHALAVKAETYVFRAAGPEGRRLLTQFDNAAPYLGRLAKACEKAAKTRGEIRTLYKRICHFPELGAGKYQWVHKALNRVIQGSSGDQMKQALVDMDAAGLFLQLQIHDEATLSCKDEAEAKRAGEIMENAVPLNLPFKCSVKTGINWGMAA